MGCIFAIPTLFILGLWGYFAYSARNLNPKYDFIYAVTQDFANNPSISSKASIGSDGSVEVINCTNPNPENINYSTFPADCAFGDLATFTYYRYTPSTKKQTPVSYENVKNTRFVVTKKSPDGYTFKGGH